LQQYLGEHVTM